MKSRSRKWKTNFTHSPSSSFSRRLSFEASLSSEWGACLRLCLLSGMRMGTCVTPGVFKINRTTREKRRASKRGKFIFRSNAEKLENFYLKKNGQLRKRTYLVYKS